MIAPKISIVTPSFNQGQFLEGTIRSVLSQRYENLEYVVIDGGSTDESPAIIEKYRDALHFACSEPDGGHIAAINKGFAKTSGEIMAWLNSDDMYFPWTFQIVAEIMSAFPEVEWISTVRPAYWDYQGHLIDVGHEIPGFSREAFLDGCYIAPTPPGTGSTMLGYFPTLQQESTFWRRSLWERAGGFVDSNYKLAADFDLWGRFFEHASCYATNVPLAGFRFQFAQKSAQRAEYVNDAERSLTQLRTRVGWKTDRTRRLVTRLQLDKIPKIKWYVRERFAYEAPHISRRDPSRPEASWRVGTIKFLRSY